MRTITSLIKNLKLLMRSKGSALVVLLAPLLIVIIIGVGFTDSKDTKLNIGIFVPDRSELALRFVTSINTSQNHIIEFQTEESCVTGIKEGFVVTCISFPQDFVIRNDKQNEMKFYVDESRVNLVYQIISSLELNVNVASKEVSQELAARLLQILDKANTEATSSLTTIVAMKAREKSSEDLSQKTNKTMTTLELGDENVDVSDINSTLYSIRTDIEGMRNDATNTVILGRSLLANIDANVTGYIELRDSLNSLNDTIDSTNSTLATLDSLQSSLGKVTSSVDKLRSKLDAGRLAKSSVISDMNTLYANLNRISLDIDGLKKRQESITTEIASFKLTNADKIVNPITTTIEHVSAGNSKITYSFPYLLMLVVLFVGIMLASTLVFMEKETRAFFRNFTTPTKSSFFVWMNYLTSVLLLMMQVMLVLIVVYFVLDIPVFTNILVTAVVIFLGINVFVLMGMFIGHLFNTSEAITMSTIAIGSVFIFLSNLILPLETLSEVIQGIAKFNPYVITSESIRKAMLFGAGFDTIWFDIVVLIVYSLILLMAVVSIKRLSTSRYFSGGGPGKKPKTVINMPEDHYLKIPEKNMTVKNLQELTDALRKLTNDEYDRLTKPRNIFSVWLRQNLKMKFLAARIVKKKREKVIKIIDNYLSKR